MMAGWKSMPDWLGYELPRKENFRPFEEAREFVRNLRLKSIDEWNLYKRGKLKDKPPKPSDIPSMPREAYYTKGWKGYSDWLGYTFSRTTYQPFKEFRKFEDAREFVRKLGLRSIKEWKAYLRGELNDKPPKPSDIPSNPNATYMLQGWKNWPDWLGYTFSRTTYQPFKKFRKFEDAREFVRKLGLKSGAEWKAYLSGELKDKPPKPPDIPSTPAQTYMMEGWISTPDWLGYDVNRKKNYNKNYSLFEDT